ncbi:MAG: phosphatase PAP2 family protein [Anaerolineae bacterium]|nr:phosphatase PAP2 family protein [Anaerolineae bacterium]
MGSQAVPRVPERPASRLARVWQAARAPLLWGLLLSFVALWAFQELAENIIAGQTIGFDNQVINLVRGATSPALTTVMEIITLFGDWRVMVPLAVIVGLLWWRQRQFGRVAVLLTAAAGGSALEQVLKLIFHRSRPDILGRLISVSGYSFPSGHAMISMCLYGILLYLFAYGRPRGVQVASLAGAALLLFGIGLSRIYLGVHYPSDVLGGYMAGFIWVMANIVAYRYYRHRTQTARQAEAPVEG